MRFSEYYQDEHVAETYDSRRMTGIKAPLVRIMERRAVLSLLPSKKMSILEAGVGTGYFTEILARKGKFEGIDISGEMIKVLRKKIRNVKLSQADILSFKTLKKYSCIISVRVISHFNELGALAALKNLAKCLEAEGVIIFNLENPSILRIVLRKLTNWGSTYTYQYSNSNLGRLLRSAKLRPVKLIYVDHLILYPLHIINKLSNGALNKLVMRLETNLENIRFSSVNVFVKCKK